MSSAEDQAPTRSADAAAPNGRHENGAKDATRRLRHGLISLAILVAIVVGLLLAVPGLHQVAHTVSDMSGGWIAVGVGFEILSCLGYVLAFLQVFERAPIRLGARVALSELAFNAAVSLGGGGGVAVGGWLLVERGAPVARVAERSAVLFLLTSAINVIVFVLAGLALFTGVVDGPSGALLTLVPAAVGTIVFLFFLALPWAIERRWLQRVPDKLRIALETTVASIRDTRRLLFSPDWRITGAVAYLLCDIAVLVVCFAAAGHVPPIGAIVLAYQIAYISNILPVPGGIGVLDGSMVGMLVLYGARASTAAAATVVYHAISLWVPAMWGTVAFLVLRRTGRQPLQLRPPLAERRRLRAQSR